MPAENVRRISDSLTLAAMAHPLRRRLLNLLKVDGPSTASVLAGRTDQHVGNVSHHLRTLAAARLVEEVPELARDRRERWWRVAATRFVWHSDDFTGDAADEAVARAAAVLDLDRQVAAVRRWWDSDDDEQAGWPNGPFASDVWLRVTDEELVEFAAELNEVILRWSERDLPDDEELRDTVLVFARAVPARP
jgi:DNA-binding transcriptional ArsR family regulator